MPSPRPEPARPDCYRCREFFVTYEPERPYGCRAFGFKSQRLPRDEVRRASGRECHAFAARPPRPGERAAGT